MSSLYMTHFIVRKEVNGSVLINYSFLHSNAVSILMPPLVRR